LGHEQFLPVRQGFFAGFALFHKSSSIDVCLISYSIHPANPDRKQKQQFSRAHIQNNYFMRWALAMRSSSPLQKPFRQEFIQYASSAVNSPAR